MVRLTLLVAPASSFQIPKEGNKTMKTKLTIAVAALATQLFAGGFYLTLGSPDANPEARKLNAVLTVKATGCHEPEKAVLTATATGMVNGQRKVIPITVTKIGGDAAMGMFAITQQWPKEGKWVIDIEARSVIDQFTNVLVAAGPNGIDRDHAKWNLKPFSPQEVEAFVAQALPAVHP